MLSYGIAAYDSTRKPASVRPFVSAFGSRLAAAIGLVPHAVSQQSRAAAIRVRLRRQRPPTAKTGGTDSGAARFMFRPFVRQAASKPCGSITNLRGAPPSNFL
ncbi:hypothetical protein [Burkholderia sp. BCC1998]|uniref:hypothetical protein n=1 Tax=Burkholderia sp. BCC1998 TaxID=2817447 RepID=UPI002AB5E5BE|nr:hypothetical protein [Burkholderia sp. BCC1998]